MQGYKGLGFYQAEKEQSLMNKINLFLKQWAIAGCYAAGSFLSSLNVFKTSYIFIFPD